MNRTYRDTQLMPAPGDGTDEPPVVLNAYRLLLGEGRGVLTMIVNEDGSPKSLTAEPELAITDATGIRGLMLTLSDSDGGLVIYDLDCAEPVARILGLPRTPIHIDGTFLRPVSSGEAMRDAA